jgi:hypothetical protein
MTTFQARPFSSPHGQNPENNGDDAEKNDFLKPLTPPAGTPLRSDSIFLMSAPSTAIKNYSSL